MILRTLKKIGKANNWYRTKHSVFGMYKGFLFNIIQSDIFENPSNKIILCRYNEISNTQGLEIKRLIENSKKKLKFTRFAISREQVKLIFYEPFLPTKAITLINALDFISEILVQREITGVFCFNKNEIAYDLSGEGVFLTQNDFIRIEGEFGLEESQTKLDNNSYTRGFFGSILFSSPIIVLWTLIENHFHLVNAGISFGIGVFASLGYKKFKGKVGIYTKPILIFSTVIIILLCNISSVYYSAWLGNAPLNEVYNFVKENKMLQKNLKNDFLLSSLAGIIACLFIIFGDNQKTIFIKEAKKI